MDPRIVLLACALTVIPMVSPAGLAGGQPGPDNGPCGAGFQDVPHQGRSRRHPSGLWEVCIRAGHTVLTHGPDGASAAPGEAGAKPGGGGGGSSRSPECVNPAYWHNHAIYAVPADKTDRYSTQESVVRGYVKQADFKLNAEAGEFGATIDYKFDCIAGEPIVSHAVLGTPSTSDSFYTIVNDLTTLGFNDARAKYWVWYDDGVGGYCGQGSIGYDDRLVPSNSNNHGNEFAITYGCGWSVMMHESGHNLGAVQLSSPNTSGAWHCNDDQDIMCYADGGPNSGNYQSNVCATEHWDCNHNDYFHPSPAAGNYLVDHWNTGHTLNRFFHFATVTGVPSDPQNLAATDGERITVVFQVRNTPITLSWNAPATTNGGAITDYWIYRTPPSGSESLLVRLAGDMFTYSDWSYTQSGTYSYRVSAMNNDGLSAGATVQAEASVTRVP